MIPIMRIKMDSHHYLYLVLEFRSVTLVGIFIGFEIVIKVANVKNVKISNIVYN